MGRPPEWDQEAFDDDVDPRPPLRGVIEVEWDDWDDEDRPRSRTPWVVAAVLLLAVGVVAALVVRAVNTDAELTLPAAPSTPSPSTTAAAPVTPTPEALQAAVPASLETCVPPPEEPTPGTVSVSCPGEGVPELVTFTLFADAAARDQAFDDTVATLELDPGAPGECALADDVVHDYVGTRGRGRVACRAADRRVDIVWTDGTDPILATLGGFGSYGEHYRAWQGLVERSDAEFPLPTEQALLDEVPAELQARCRRDIDLVEQADGIVAVACEPATGTAEVVSWVRFGDADAMTAWIDGRRLGLGDVETDTSPQACTLDGAGPNGQLAQPWLGASPYERDGTTGRILCFVSSSEQNVLVWTRARSNIGSIAVVDVPPEGQQPPADDGEIPPGSMLDLIAWWAGGGYRP